MNVYEAMATQRAVRRLRPDPFQGLLLSVFFKLPPGRLQVAMYSLFEW